MLFKNQLNTSKLKDPVCNDIESQQSIKVKKQDENSNKYMGKMGKA